MGFEVDALSKQVPTIEFADFVARRKKGAYVDVAAIPVMSHQRGMAAHGEFNGWADQLNSCDAGGQRLPQMEGMPSGGSSVVYSGYCDGNIAAKQVACGLLRRLSRNSL